MGENGNTENNYTLAWLQPLPDESVHLQPCYSASPSEIFIMQRWGLGACSVLYSQAATTGELEECSPVLHSFCLKVPSTPASWKYHADLHFYLILMYSSEVMISKYRGSRFLALFASNKQCKLSLLSSVFLIDQRGNLGLSYAIKEMH